MENQSGQRRMLMAVATSLAAILVTFLLCEFALRVYQRIDRGISLTTRFPQYRETQFTLSPFLVFGPRVDWQIPDKRFPELAYFNEQGIRNPAPIGPKRPAEFRIFAIGGSTTENVWNDLGIHWPLVLECSLREAGYANVTVHNTAMSAYTTAHSLIRLQYDVLDYDPDMLIVMHNVNDLAVSYYAAHRGKPVDGHYHVMYGDDRYTNTVSEEDVVVSRFLWFLQTRIGEILAKPEAPVEDHDLREGLKIFRRNLRTLAQVARGHDVEPVFLTMPATDRVPYAGIRSAGNRRVGFFDFEPPVDRKVRDIDVYNGAVIEVADALEIPAIDMAGVFGDDPGDFVDVVHYSSTGIRRFGEILAAEVAPLLPDSLRGPPAHRALPPSCTVWGDRGAIKPVDD